MYTCAYYIIPDYIVTHAYHTQFTYACETHLR